ncbi:MAG: PmoA family protein [Phycisphaeraceae bacterium]
MNHLLRRSSVISVVLISLLLGALRADLPDKPLPPVPRVPRVQVLPLPRREASMQIDGKELARYYFDRDQERPFLYPVTGPAGRSLTRMGHPHDPVSHSHHNSVWISHNDVEGIDFWSDRRHGIIEHQRILKYDDGEEEASIFALNHWKVTGLGKDKDAKPQAARVLLIERRVMTLRPLAKGESMIVIDLQFNAPGKEPVTFNQNAFGLVGVRMAKPIGINDGGGTIRNSEGNIDEQGDNGCFRKPAKWCDYSGRITNEVVEGITLMDHPSNVNHPTPFHVRADGWMGACLSLEKAITVTPEKPLRLRYALFVHSGAPTRDELEERWQTFAKSEVKDLPAK